MSYHILTFTSNSPSAICWKIFNHHISKNSTKTTRRQVQVVLPAYSSRTNANIRYLYRKQLNYFLVLDLIANYQRHYTLLQSAHQTRQKATCNYTIRLIHKLPASVYFCCQSRCLLENKGSQHLPCLALFLLYSFPFRGEITLHSSSSPVKLPLWSPHAEACSGCTGAQLCLQWVLHPSSSKLCETRQWDGETNWFY